MNIPTTDELLKRLESADTPQALDRYAQDIAGQMPAPTFPVYLEARLAASGLTPAELIRSAQIQRNYGYQILNGLKRPGRDKVIALCLALSLPLEEVQRALLLAKEGGLYPKNPRDAILIFCINRQLSVLDANQLLDERGEAPL